MIAIIKYNAGNITSVKNAIERLGFECIVTDDEQQIRSAEKVIFPGVGEASSAINYLRERQLDKLIISLIQPVLGICLGQQLMCKFSEEGNTNCLGIFDVQVKKFPSTDSGIRTWHLVLFRHLAFIPFRAEDLSQLASAP